MEYAKEIESLNSKLKEANTTVENENKNRIRMQESLKKAFMRGVCALNFEAMNAINPSSNSMDPFMEMMNTAQEQPKAEEVIPSNFAQATFDSAINSAANQIDQPIIEPKIESKDHLWKPAPILAKDFSNPNPATMPSAMMKLDGRSALLLEARKENEQAISAMGEQEIRCERIDTNNVEEENNAEGVESRTVFSSKQMVSVPPAATTCVPTSAGEGKVIRVNKYGKSYADSINSSEAKQPKPKQREEKKKTIGKNTKK